MQLALSGVHQAETAIVDGDISIPSAMEHCDGLNTWIIKVTKRVKNKVESTEGESR